MAKIKDILKLFSTTTIWVSAYAFYHFPQLFAGVLINKFNITTVEVSYLYTASALPTFICNMIAGVMVDKITLGLSGLIFTSLVFFGIFLVFLGFQLENFTFLIVGRVVFGIGFDTCYLAESIAAERFYSGANITVIYSLNRSFAYFTGFVFDYLQPLIFTQYRTMKPVIFIYAVLSAFSFLSPVYMVYIDNQFEASSKKGDRNNNDKKRRKFSISDLKKIKRLTWLIITFMCIAPQGFAQFVNIATDFLIKRFSMNFLEAKSVISIIPLTQMILIPCFSTIISYKGKKAYSLLVACLILSFTFCNVLVMGNRPPHYKVYLVVIGGCTFWSLYISAVWSSLVISIPRQATAFVLGLTTSIQSIFYGLVPLLFGQINKRRSRMAYQNSTWVLLLISLVSCFLACLIIYFDSKGDRILDYSEKDSRVREIRSKMALDYQRELEMEYYESLGKETINGVKM